MPGSVSETSIEEIAELLKNRRGQEQRVGLLLGHRAGVLFNDTLYEAVKRRTMIADDLPKLLKRDVSPINDLSEMLYHIQSLNNLSAIDKFCACYSFLGKYFNENGIHDILYSILDPARPRYREEDKLMATLIKAGFFDTIITTNIDPSLEEACDQLQMEESVDYRLIRCGVDDSKALGQGSILRRQSKGKQIVKVFGDFDSVKYNRVGKEFDLEIDQLLKGFLISELAKDIIILGYDPLWDWPIERAIQVADGKLWYVNEERPLKNSHLAYVLNQRNVKYLVGPQGSYNPFLRTLNNIIGGVNSASSTITPQPQRQTPQSQNQTREKAFISYSHRDSRHMERLLIHLNGYLFTGSAENVLDIWVDTRIPPGADWKEEVRKALSSAKIAILLISADFLASKFIREYELPVLLDAAKSGEIRILPVVLGPSAFERTELYRYQVAENSFSQPLTKLKPYERNVAWKKLSEQIVDILGLQE